MSLNALHSCMEIWWSLKFRKLLQEELHLVFIVHAPFLVLWTLSSLDSLLWAWQYLELVKGNTNAWLIAKKKRKERRLVHSTISRLKRRSIQAWFIWRSLTKHSYKELFHCFSKDTVQGTQGRHRHPIDFCYVRPQHVPIVNAMCRTFFWPGIDCEWDKFGQTLFRCFAEMRAEVAFVQLLIFN